MRSILRKSRSAAYPIRGRHGHLFLGGDSCNVLAQHEGRLVLSARAERAWHDLLRSRARRLHDLGVPWVSVVAPDKEAIYPDEMHDCTRLAARRPIHRIIEMARELELMISYPDTALRHSRALREPYYATDAHWNWWGAFIAYGEICRLANAQGIAVEQLSEHDVEWTEYDVPGELGSKLDSVERGPAVYGEPLRHTSVLLHDNVIRNHGRVIHLEANDPSRPSAILVGESYSGFLLTFLKESFGRLVYLHASEFDFRMIKRFRPDLLIWNPTERFMIDVPSDRGAASRLEVLRWRKRLDGRVVDMDRRLRGIPRAGASSG